MATRYWVPSGGNESGSWADTAHWSTTSGGAGGASVPVGTDDVIFDANSGYQFIVTLPTSTDTYWANFRSIDTTGIGYGMSQSLMFGVSGQPTQMMNCWGTSPNTSTPLIKLGPATQFNTGNTYLSINGGLCVLSYPGGWLPFVYIWNKANLFLANDISLLPNSRWNIYDGSLTSNGKNITGGPSTRLDFNPMSAGYTANVVFSSPSIITVSQFFVRDPSKGTFSSPAEFRIYESIAYSGTSVLPATKITMLSGGSTATDLPNLTGNWNIGTLDITAAPRVYFSSDGYGSTPLTVATFVTTNAAPVKTLNKVSWQAYPWQIRKTGAVVNADYLNVSNSSGLPFTASPNYAWIAGPNSIDGGGNTGWKFSLPTCSFTASGVGAVPAVGGTQTVASVATSNPPCENGSWTASTIPATPAWITALSPTSGTGADPLKYITATIAENTTTSSRSGVIRVNGQDITVTQSPAALNCSYQCDSLVELAYGSGSTATLTITHSPSDCAVGTWSITGLAAGSSWVSATPTTGGLADTSVVFTTLSVNTDVISRVIVCRLVSSTGYETPDFYVTQEPAPPVTCTNFLSSLPGPFYYDAPAATLDLTVAASPSGCAAGTLVLSSDSAWLSAIGYVPIITGDFWWIGEYPYPIDGLPATLTGPYRIGITLEENTGGPARQGILTLTSEVGTPQELVFNQLGTDVPVECTSFSTAQAGPYDVSSAASNNSTQQIITITASPSGCTGGSWTKETDVPWLAASTPVNGTFYVTWSANTGAERVGHVVLHGTPDQVITFTQAAYVPPVETCSTLSCSLSGGYTVESLQSTALTQKAFTLSGNTPTCTFDNLSVVSSDSWLVLATVNSKSYYVTWSENVGTTSRTATISATYTPTGGTSTTAVLFTITQSAPVISVFPPYPPTNVVASLNANHTATVTWDDGGQTGLTDTLLQPVLNGVKGTAISVGRVLSYTTSTLLPDLPYNFRVTLVNSVGQSTTVTSNSIIDNSIVPVSSVKPPTFVRATFDDPTQSILLEWDLNGQTDLYSYSIIGIEAGATNPQIKVPIATQLSITDISSFVNGEYYSFKIALTRQLGGVSFTSQYTTSNTILISKPTNPRNIYRTSFFESVSDSNGESVPVSHLVHKRSNTGVPITATNYYAKDGKSLAYVSYIPVEKSFTDHVFTITNSYGDTLTATTTWNYENRVGIVYFELPPDTNITSDGVSLFFKIAPETYNTIYNSNNVTLEYYALNPDYIVSGSNNTLQIRKEAYLITNNSPTVCESSSLADLKAAGTAYIVKKLNSSSLIRLTEDRRIAALRFSFSLAEKAELPTGFNYVPILVSSLLLGVEETTIPHPLNFSLLPTADDIKIKWDAPDYDKIAGYRVDIQKELDQEGVYGIYYGNTAVALEGVWASMDILNPVGTSMEVSLKAQSGLFDPPQDWDSTKKYSVRVTTLSNDFTPLRAGS